MNKRPSTLATATHEAIDEIVREILEQHGASQDDVVRMIATDAVEAFAKRLLLGLRLAGFSLNSPKG